MNLDDVAMLLAGPSADAATAALSHAVDDLGEQLAVVPQYMARIATLERRIEDLARLLHSSGPAPVDWEHPGKIGAASANTAKFTTLEATSTVKLNPKDQPVDLKPTGTALITIQPAQTGQIDNMELGKTAPCLARVQTLNKLTFTQPATGATYTLADGKTFAVSSSMTLTGNDGATLNIGGGGTLGSAAYASSGDFAGRTNTALGAAATDPATTQALANSLRAALISVGIGT